MTVRCLISQSRAEVDLKGCKKRFLRLSEWGMNLPSLVFWVISADVYFGSAVWQKKAEMFIFGGGWLINI